jgi:hypothetical protein
MFVREGGDCGNDVNAVFNDTPKAATTTSKSRSASVEAPTSSEITGWSRCPTSRQPRSWPSPWTQKSAE